jgi:hypothetical protein
MKFFLWLVLSPLAAATATYLAAAPPSDVPAKARGSVISRAVEAFDQAGVTYGYRQLGGQKFSDLAARLGYDRRGYYDIARLTVGPVAGKPAMTDAQLLALSEHIAAFPQLESLDVRANHFTVKGLESLPPLPKLTHLYLGGPGIPNDIVFVLERFPALRDLRLEKTSVTALGVKVIKTRFPSCQVIVK